MKGGRKKEAEMRKQKNTGGGRGEWKRESKKMRR